MPQWNTKPSALHLLKEFCSCSEQSDSVQRDSTFTRKPPPNKLLDIVTASKQTPSLGKTINAMCV